MGLKRMDKVIPFHQGERLKEKLIRACREGRLDEARHLLGLMASEKTERDPKTDFYWPAFDATEDNNQIEIQHLLLDTLMEEWLAAEDMELNFLIDRAVDESTYHPDLEKAMDWAIKLSRPGRVKDLLKLGGSVEGPKNSTWTRLMYALQDGDLEIAGCFIEGGADVNFFGICDTTPLMVACGEGDLAAVKLLLEHGANPCNPTRDQEGCDILMYACIGGNPEIVNLLLDEYSCGLLMGTTSGSGNSALMLAVERGHYEVARLLLERGARVNDHNGRGESALSLAIKSGNHDLMALFLGKYMEAVKQERHTPLTRAAENNDFEVVKLLLNEGFAVNQADKFGRTPLMAAASGGHLRVIEVLLDHGADIAISNAAGDTAITLALKYWCFENYRETVKFLLERSGKPPWESLLLWALRSGFRDALNFLLHCGAETNYPLGGCKPLLFACSLGDIPAVDLLIDHGADLNFVGRGFPTPLKLAATLGNIKLVQLLLWRGAEVDARLAPGSFMISVPEEFHRELVGSLNLKASDPNPLSALSWTPLMAAAAMGRNKVVRMLLQNGANANMGDGEGRTALMLAVKRGHLAVVKTLVEKGADVNPTDRQGITALKQASDSGNLEIIGLLLEKGADIDAKDKGGRTALTLALKRGNAAVVELLKAHGAKE